MKKVEIYQTIKTRCDGLWLEMAKYDFDNKPVFVDTIASMKWDVEDIGHQKLLNQWYSLKLLMEELKIDDEFTSSAAEATEIRHEIFKREQHARGIDYDENGNRIA